MVKAVFFDLYNTLACFDPAREDLQQKVCAEYGIQVTREGILKGYVPADDFMGRENARIHLAKRTEQEQWDFFAEYERIILRGAGIEVPSKLAGEIFQAIRKIPYHLALYDDAIPCIQSLKSAGLVVGMITNIYSDLKRTCDRLGLSQCLDFWVTSKEAGSEKPHPAISKWPFPRPESRPTSPFTSATSITRTSPAPEAQESPRSSLIGPASPASRTALRCTGSQKSLISSSL